MLERRYVWELPVRLIHWATFLSVIVLCITGYYIANPFMRGEAYLMGWMRFTHALAAIVFDVGLLARFYWAFVGNRYARWSELIPLSRERRAGLVQMLAYYLFLRRDPYPSVGHNPLAGLAYFLLFLAFIVQTLTGFALWSAGYQSGFWPLAVGWILTVFGSQTVRLVHYFLLWILIAWLIHHVYSNVLVDSEEKTGLISSMFTGYKTVRSRDA